MKHNKRHTLFSLLALAFFAFQCSYATADVRLPRLLSDGAILQRDKPLNVWGWADPGENVSVKLGKHQLNTVADQSGKWSVKLPKQKAGGPHKVLIQGKNTIELKDVWFGDLWIAAGQSNMELPLRRVSQLYTDVIPNTNIPQIRQYSVPLTYSLHEAKEDYETGSWKTAVPENLPEFSAVGFFFAEELWKQLNVPIGILSISVGGSPAQAWVSEKALEKYPHYLAEAHIWKDTEYLKKTLENDKNNTEHWYQKAQNEDKGLLADKPWYEDINTSSWESLTVPGSFASQGIEFKNGVIWLKKTIELTEKQASQDATLWLGTLNDGDETYVNGKNVGNIGYKYPPRIYSVNSDILKPGKNTITIRLTSYSNDPGFTLDKTYALTFGKEALDISGEWQYQIGMQAGSMPATTTMHYQPASLFKAKLAPAFPFKIKGVIWYQGESNIQRSKSLHPIPPHLVPTSSSAEEYTTLFQDLILDWRKHFNQGDFPFLFVQLANLNEAQTMPGESEMAELREAQMKALAMKNTAMAVAIDKGEWNDIHPLAKKDLGQRLALGARKIAYGEKSLVASGPTVKSAKRKGDMIIITFDNVGKGLNISEQKLNHISIAGEDKRFVWANATVYKNQIILSAENVKKPTWVRYAWADNPEGANLYNSEGLPASPFEIKVK